MVALSPTWSATRAVSLRREHLRQGRVVVADFSHKSGSTCTGESILHLSAKMRLAHALTHREQSFVIRRVCQRFGCEATHDEPWQPPAFDHAAEEVALGDYRLDVAAMREQSAVFGFEVYHRHRVGRVKAAQLSVPWLELQAEATARDPYVLCPVVDELIVGDDEKDLRCGLRTTRAELPEKLAWRLSQPHLLYRYLEGTRVPPKLVNLIFYARSEGGSGLVLWWCPACAAQREAQTALRRADIERQTAERHSALQEHRRAIQQALTEQREVFGAELMHPFKPGVVEFFRKDAAALRFAASYLGHPADQLLEHFEKHSRLVLIARRCRSCHWPILCVDPLEPAERFQFFSPWVERVSPGYPISECRRCGERQDPFGLYEGKYRLLYAHSLAVWLRAFLPASQHSVEFN
ncbi:hypothetical protein DEMA109039_00305 [Deinococcus marmoris]